MHLTQHFGTQRTGWWDTHWFTQGMDRKVSCVYGGALLADEVHTHSCPSRLSRCTWIPFLFGFCTLLRLYDMSPYLPHDDSHVDILGTIRLSSCWLYVTFICWRNTHLSWSGSLSGCLVVWSVLQSVIWGSSKCSNFRILFRGDVCWLSSHLK
jgi:hypothetical protein